ncbi:uncharacterized protein LTHEOB_3297 [Neofusicoccum parvum]|nr:uncharacterized protein LTHEOB_3297 [Neofusicoccum parvum]
MNRYLLIFCFLLALCLALPEKGKHCGNTPYDPSKATCYDGYLCPIVGGLANLKCGDECYSPLTYKCENQTLCPLAPTEGPYEIRVSNPDEHFDDYVINACHGGFFIGGPTCTYCPSQLPDLCEASKNITALVGNEGMQVVVPGGQRFYINPIGSLAYTQAHSAFIPGGSIVGKIEAFQDGGFVYAEGGGWYACPVSDPDTYQIVNRLEGVVLDAACIGINIVTNSVDGGPFAWQYA